MVTGHGPKGFPFPLLVAVGVCVGLVPDGVVGGGVPPFVAGVVLGVPLGWVVSPGVAVGEAVLLCVSMKIVTEEPLGSIVPAAGSWL